MLGLGVLRLEIRTDGAAIHPSDSPVVDATRADQREFFESDQVIVLVSSRPGGPNVDSRDGLRFLKGLHGTIESLPGVYSRRVRSLATLIDPRPEVPVIQSQDFLAEIPEDATAYDALMRRIARSPLGPGLFLARSGKSAAIYVPTLRGASRARLVSDLQRTLAEQSSEFRLRLTGPVTAEVLLGQAVLSDLARLVPVMVALMALLLFACLRSVGGVLVPMAEIGMVLGCTLGVMGHLGVPITLVTTILPVLLMTVAVTDEIHLLERFRAHLHGSSGPNRSRAAMSRALGDVARPIVLTSLTTSIGFLSFLTASMAPIRHFGLFTALGVLFAMALSFTFVPALVVLLPSSWFDEWWTRASVRPTPPSRLRPHTAAVALTCAALLLVLAAPGLRRLAVQDSWVENFDPQSDLVSADRDFNREFWGSYRFDVVLETPEALFFMGAEGLRLVDALSRVARSGPNVGGVASHLLAYQIVADVWQESGRVYELGPEKIARIARLLNNVSRRTDVDQVLNANGAKARLRLFVRSANYERADELRSHLERKLLPLLEGTGVAARFSGDLPLASAVVGGIVSNMLRSIGWTTVGVAILLLIFFRRTSAAASAMLPLSVGIPLLLGIMGCAGMSIGIATSMFAAVGIGIAIDFSIHFSHAYNANRTGAVDHPHALAATLHSAGRALRWNAIVLALGLLVLALSALKPNRSLGLLLATTVFVCYLATVFLLPPLLERIWRANGIR